MLDRVVGTPAELGDRLVHEVTAAGAEALATRGQFTLALSGGSVATLYFPRLAAAAFDWSRADFFWADERAVGPVDPDSNCALARSLWLDPARVPSARVHRMVGEASDLDAAARAYATDLERLAGAPPRLDVVLLGVGPDGHVASLFPGHALLAETGRSVAAVTDSPKPPPRRLTLTLPVLTAAPLVVIAAAGAEKAAILHTALLDSHSTLPVALVVQRARRVLCLLDPAAAGTDLGGRGQPPSPPDASGPAAPRRA